MASNWSVLQLASIRFLANGFTPLETSKVLRVKAKQLRQWLTDPAFVLAVEQVVRSHDAAMRDLLLLGEEVAVITALDVMQNAVTDKAKIDYKTRLQAAIEFLNRKGERGAPVQREETKNLNLSGNVNDALQAALRDPGVRQWLDGEPEVLKALTGGSDEPTTISGSPEGATAAPSPVGVESDFELIEND